MVIDRIPKLNIRPKHLIKVYSYNINSPIPLFRSMDNTEIEKLRNLINSITQNEPIGIIQSITITSSRGVEFYRTLNYDHLGKIRETYPGLPNHTARAEVIALYRSHLLNAFKATEQGDVFMKSSEQDSSVTPTFNIYNQIAPLLIKIDMLENDQNVKSILLWDCWFKNSDIKFEITSENDLAVIQEADITFAYPLAI